MTLASTHAIRLTPPTAGAIAVVLLVGPNARAAMAQLRCAGKCPAPNHARLANLTHDGQPIDQALIVALSDDRFELHLHGGTAVVTALLDAFSTLGVSVLDPGSTEAAELLTVSHPTIAAEALTVLPRALTSTAVHLLANQSHAGLTAWARHWHDTLNPTTSSSVGIPLWSCHAAGQWISDRSDALAFLLDPPRIAIVGPPNAGKSTLANALLGRPVSITHHLPGTTRDWVDTLATFNSPSATQLAVTLVDTAGIRATPDPIEQESINRTRTQIAAAHVIVALLDSTTPPDAGTATWLNDLQSHATPSILVLNKSDQPPAWQPDLPHIRISALRDEGLDRLMAAALDQLNLAAVDPREPFIFTTRQRTLVQQLTESAGTAHAIALLNELLGQPSTQPSTPLA